jgi:hypothetical protein
MPAIRLNEVGHIFNRIDGPDRTRDGEPCINLNGELCRLLSKGSAGRNKQRGGNKPTLPLIRIVFVEVHMFLSFVFS